MATQIEIRQRITDEIVTAIKSGVLPWRKPWTTNPNAGNAKNIVSKKAYRGVNPILLELASRRHGFSSRWWGTFRQWEGLGGQVTKRPPNVRPGCWGTKIIFFQPVKKVERDTNGEEQEGRFLLMKEYTVFNVDQVSGIEHLQAMNTPVVEEAVVPNYEDADRVIEATKADIRFGGDRAFYSRSGDYIQMPNRGQFNGGEYYETAFHELAHWSESRLNWKGSYSLGELIAELASCFVSAEVGVPVVERLDNHASYVASWLRSLQDDPRMVFQASSQASKVSDYILAFSRPQEEPIDEEEAVIATA